MDGTKLPPKSANLTTVREESDDEQVQERVVNTIDKDTSHAGLITHQVSCNGVPVLGTFDTGANATVMSLKLAQKLNLEILPSFSKIKAAGSNLLKNKGFSKVNSAVLIGNLERSIRKSILIVENLAMDLLIGNDVMGKLNVLIDTKEKQLRFNRTKSSSVVSSKHVTVPLRSQMVIKGKIPRNLTNDVLIVPSQVNNKLSVANCISKVIDKEVDLVVLNTSTELQNIEENKKVAAYGEYNPPVTLKTTVKLDQTDELLRVGDKLTNEEVSELKQLVIDNIQAFSTRGEIGSTNILSHKIELLDNTKTVTEPLRRRPQEQIEETRKQVKKLLEENIIELSDSPWASAYVLAKKKTGDWRLCIDFRRLNDLTKKTVYPLPLIEDCLDTLCGKNYFSQLDFASGFWQIPMDPSSKELTAFRTEDGLFQFTRMPFGLTNAPASFQKMINILLSGVKGLNVQVFIDDVCIATNTWSEHKELLSQIFKLIIQANLKLKISKCLFGASRDVFLGHEISSEGIKQDPNKLKALVQLPSPKDVSGVRRFLGMCSYYRKFVPRFAMIADPLVKLT